MFERFLVWFGFKIYFICDLFVLYMRGIFGLYESTYKIHWKLFKLLSYTI